MNSVFLVSLARPGDVIASIGITAGGAVFALVTTVAAVRVLRRVDYHYYASY